MALDLFGRGVAGRPHHGAQRLCDRRLGKGPGQAEVSDKETPVVVEEEVRRLYVPVDKTAPVGVGESIGGLRPDRSGLLGAQEVARVQQRTQAPPSEVLEHEIRDAVLVAPVVDVEHVAVIERGGEAGLCLELAQEGGVAGEGGVEQLDSDAPVQPSVIGCEDLGRSTGADHGKESVPAADDPADLFHGARHGYQPKG